MYIPQTARWPASLTLIRGAADVVDDDVDMVRDWTGRQKGCKEERNRPTVVAAEPALIDFSRIRSCKITHDQASVNR